MRLIKVGATWCGPCNVMDKRLENFNTCEYKHYDVDNEDDETLAVIDKYNIRNVPVIVLEGDNDEELKKWVGLVSVDDINKEIESHK